MNQQEIDRLFEQGSFENDDYSPDRVMFIGGFERAAAEIRRQARQEVGQLKRALSDLIGHLESHFHSPYCQISDAGEDAAIEQAKALLAAQPNGAEGERC